MDEKLNYIYTGILSYKGILFPLEQTIAKKVFIENYILPEHYYLFRAIIEFLLFIILTPILYFSLWFNEDGAFNLASNIPNMVILSIILLIYLFLYEFITLKVIYYFSVQSVAFLVISESVTCSISTITKFFTEKKSNRYKIIFLSIDIIIILLTAFATFIYNEIIIIKVCGLDKNVGKEIISRSISEYKQMNILSEEGENVSEARLIYEDDNIKIELQENIK